MTGDSGLRSLSALWWTRTVFKLGLRPGWVQAAQRKTYLLETPVGWTHVEHTQLQTCLDCNVETKDTLGSNTLTGLISKRDMG